MSGPAPLQPVHTVLVVDDDEDVLGAITQVLTHQGLRVLATPDAREVLALIAADGDVAVVISDVDMPQLNGIDLVLAIKEAHPEVVRVMLTGNASMQPVLRAINEGEVFRYLTKPCKNSELVKVVHEALEQAVKNRRATLAEAHEARRSARLSELEKAWPGISVLTGGEGGHELRAEDLAELERRLGRKGPLLVAAVLEELAAELGAG